jgi:ribosomal protein S18 acetylase RimI-like enzyme
VALGLALATALANYYAFSDELPDIGLWEDVAFLTFVLLPATLLVVWLALPLRRSRTLYLGLAAVSLGVATVLLELADLDVAANFIKLAAVVAAGWWFLTFFEAVSWVVLVSFLIIPVDIVSVARGPTREIVENQPQVFDALSIAFPIPGEHNSAQLGLPDILFFALFLAAAARFGLRLGWTWLVMALSFGTTLALAVAFDVAGLPALPLLSVAFVLVNADLLWRSLRARFRIRAASDSEEDVRFLWAILALAAAWRSRQPAAGVSSDPSVARYVEGWGRRGDAGVIAEEAAGRPLGAAWYRLFTETEPGYGFIDPGIPEVSIGVEADARGQGIGTALLEALIERARAEGFPSLSLSVEDDNPAVRLYERAGFRTIGREGNARTMQLDL